LVDFLKRQQLRPTRRESRLTIWSLWEHKEEQTKVGYYYSMGMQSKFVDKKKEHSLVCSLPGSESKCTYSKHHIKTCHITTNVVSCMDSQASKVLHSQPVHHAGWMDGWMDG
jgi:hypothetical protein